MNPEDDPGVRDVVRVADMLNIALIALSVRLGVFLALGVSVAGFVAAFVLGTWQAFACAMGLGVTLAAIVLPDKEK